VGAVNETIPLCANTTASGAIAPEMPTCCEAADGPEADVRALSDLRLQKEICVGFDHRVHRDMQRVYPLATLFDVFVRGMLLARRNLATVLATINFHNLGIFRLENAPADPGRVVAELYCQRMELAIAPG
jgi:hypothetical protein